MKIKDLSLREFYNILTDKATEWATKLSFDNPSDALRNDITIEEFLKEYGDYEE